MVRVGPTERDDKRHPMAEEGLGPLGKQKLRGRANQLSLGIASGQGEEWSTVNEARGLSDVAAADRDAPLAAPTPQRDPQALHKRRYFWVCQQLVHLQSGRDARWLALGASEPPFPPPSLSRLERYTIYP